MSQWYITCCIIENPSLLWSICLLLLHPLVAQTAAVTLNYLRNTYIWIQKILLHQPPSLESDSSNLNLPPEHFTRARPMPSFGVLKCLQNMSIRKVPTTPRQVSSLDDVQNNNRSILSWGPEFSDSAFPSPFEPPSPDITFHGNPKGPEEKPTWRVINYNPSCRCL